MNNQEKPLPHSAEAERAVLGAVLLDNRVFDQAAELLVSEDFYLDKHRRIFDTIVSLAGASRAIDILTLREELERRTDLDAAGGVAYIASLVDGVPRVANIEQYARIVKKKTTLRKLAYLGNRLLHRSMEGEDEAADLLELAEKTIFHLGQDRRRTGLVPLPELLSDAYRNLEELSKEPETVTGLATGYADLDRMLGGLQPGNLVIVAARPGMGKTSLALNIAAHVTLQQQKAAAVFSLEMTCREVVNRILSSEARVAGNKMRSGNLSQEDWQKLAGSVSRLSQARLFIDDTSEITPMEMRSKSRQLAVEQGLDLLIVDYLQLMSAGGRRHENRQQEVTAISRGLKSLAKELDVPLVALSQLSRAPETRRGKPEPILSDLRESGSIEQDADVVLFIYRESLGKTPEDLDEEDHFAQIIIGKQRNGPTGRVKLTFMGEWTRFENAAESSRYI